jgi:hypothetical protein
MAQFGIHFVLPFITSGLVFGSLYDSLYPIDLDYLGSCSTFQFRVPKSTAPLPFAELDKERRRGQLTIAPNADQQFFDTNTSMFF